MFMPEGVGHRLHHSGDWSYHNPGDWDMYRAERIAIGIRLGQRWCSVSCIEDGKVRDLINKIPSLVTFTQNETYYGSEAIRYSITNIDNSIYQFFGLLGKKYFDKSVQQLLKHVTYSIIRIDRSLHPQIPSYSLINEDIGIPIKFTSTGKPHIFTVIEIVSQFLEHIVKAAEDKMGCPIAHVAISIPNTFGQSQRLALMQAAKEVNIEPLRLVTSCMAASVCLRYYEIHKNDDDDDDDDDDKKDEKKEEEDEEKEKEKEKEFEFKKEEYNDNNNNDNDIKQEIDSNNIDYNNSPYYNEHDEDEYNNNFSSIYNNHNNNKLKNGKTQRNNKSNKLNINGYYNGYSNGHLQENKNKNKKNKKKKNSKNKNIDKNKKKGHKNKCYLIADLSNIACSLSIIECKAKRHSDIVKVHHCSGNINYGIWKMINSFSLYVVKSFVDGYKGYYRPNLSDIDNSKKTKWIKKSENIHIDKNKKKQENGRDKPYNISFYESISKYNYKNDPFVYKQLQQIEEIEKEEDDDDEYDDDDDEKGDNSDNNEALKCRFRSQMLCDTIIEHLHDQYKNEEVQIHYEKFYRSFSLQLILTTAKLHEIALNPFLFNMMNCIDVILQEYDNNIVIDECVLIGDGGNIPEVVSLFGEYFNINHDLEFEPIISRGCAIVAAVDQELVSSPICLDLLPISIRMEDATNNNHNNNTLIISSQNPCPCKKTVTRYTYLNNQTIYKMKFYEGESNNNKLCQLIGIFEIRDIIKRPKRETKIVIVIHIDRNCIMVISAEDVTSKPPKELNVIKLNH